MIEFHGDNKLLSEFVMWHRSNIFAIIWKDASHVFIFASTNGDQDTDESSENNPIPRAFSLAWGCSENYVNLALAGFFAIKVKRFAPSNLTDTV